MITECGAQPHSFSARHGGRYRLHRELILAARRQRTAAGKVAILIRFVSCFEVLFVLPIVWL